MTTSDASTPSMTRRRLLAVGGTVALGGVACYLGWPEGPAATSTVDSKKPGKSSAAVEPKDFDESVAPSEFSRKRFAPHVGTDFQIAAGGTACRLVEVGDNFPSSGPAGDFVSFSLMFTAAAGSTVESAIHTLQHPVLGEFDLFLSPVGPGDEELYLEAVCCRRV